MKIDHLHQKQSLSAAVSRKALAVTTAETSQQLLVVEVRYGSGC
jgi:hypothetical protein